MLIFRQPVLLSLALGSLVVALPQTGSAQDARLEAAKAAALKIRADDIFRDVSYLGSDANRGRRTHQPLQPDSPGYDSSATYIAKLLKELGIKPMGDNGTYFQHYTVTRVTLDTNKVSGAIGSTPIKWGDDFIVSNFLVPGVREADVIYVGNGLKRKGKTDPYAGLDIKGKWILVHNTTLGGRGGRGAPGDTMGRVGIDYTTFRDEDKARGALGILFVPTQAQLNGWSRQALAKQDLNPSVGTAYSQDRVPQIVLSRNTVRQLLTGTKVSADQVLAADSTRQYPASASLGKKVKIDFAATTIDVRPYNVVGMLEGSDPRVKDEWISLAAHLDGATPPGGIRGDDAYNAADDNASGSAGNMAIVRALVAGPRPKRSILLIWDSGEEVGLWGTRTIAYGPWSEKITLHVSNDMIGRSKPAGATGYQNLSGPDEIYVTGPKLLSTNTESNLQKASKEFPFIQLNRIYEDYDSEFYYPRTDAGPYLERGIPIMQFFNGTHPEYHQPTDDVPRLDIPKIEKVSRLSYGALWLAADAVDKPKWDGPVPYTLWWVTPKK